MDNVNIPKLVKQLQNGDISVFDDIYYETKNVVFYTILNIIKDYSLSEDIMQDTYLQALAKIHSYKPTHSFKSWIATIAKNLALNEYNKRKKTNTIDIQENESLFGSTASTIENKILIEQIFQILNETEREVVLLHVVADMKHKDIASIVNKPLGTVTWIYKTAIEKLRNQLEESR